MIINKSINGLIVFSIKFTITKLLYFFNKNCLFPRTCFFLVKLLFFRLTISSPFIETPLMTICWSVWLVLAPFFKCINRRFAASTDNVGLEAGPRSLRRCRINFCLSWWVSSPHSIRPRLLDYTFKRYRATPLISKYIIPSIWRTNQYLVAQENGFRALESYVYVCGRTVFLEWWIIFSLISLQVLHVHLVHFAFHLISPFFLFCFAY